MRRKGLEVFHEEGICGVNATERCNLDSLSSLRQRVSALKEGISRPAVESRTIREVADRVADGNGGINVVSPESGSRSTSEEWLWRSTSAGACRAFILFNRPGAKRRPIKLIFPYTFPDDMTSKTRTMLFPVRCHPPAHHPLIPLCHSPSSEALEPSAVQRSPSFASIRLARLHAQGRLLSDPVIHPSISLPSHLGRYIAYLPGNEGRSVSYPEWALVCGTHRWKARKAAAERR